MDIMDITVTTLLNGSVSQISPSLLLSSSLWLYCMRIYTLLTGTTLTQLLFFFHAFSLSHTHTHTHSFIYFSSLFVFYIWRASLSTLVPSISCSVLFSLDKFRPIFRGCCMHYEYKYGFVKLSLKILPEILLKKGSFFRFSFNVCQSTKSRWAKRKLWKINKRYPFGLFFFICINGVCLLLLNCAVFRFQIINTRIGWQGMANYI